MDAATRERALNARKLNDGLDISDDEVRQLEATVNDLVVKNNGDIALTILDVLEMKEWHLKKKMFVAFMLGTVQGQEACQFAHMLQEMAQGRTARV